jgi:hypothetical protein
MGAGPSKHYRSPAERRKREQRAREKLKKKNALKAERDLWLRNHKIEEVEKKWWRMGWWPVYEWWRERKGWEEEMGRRRREGRRDDEGVLLRAHQD